LLFTFQIYADFSGYSDIAIGCAKLFGIRLTTNFKVPYFSRNVREFWRRWHITLMNWFTQYVYFPLGGSRCSRLRTILNTLIVFALSGLWHGADWTFILWGAIHGLVMVIERMAGEKLTKIPAIIRRTVTLFIVNAGWVLFRSESVSGALVMLKRMFVPAPGTSVFALSPQFYASFGMDSLYFISAHLNIAVFIPFAAVLLTTVFVKKDIYAMDLKPGKLTALLTALLLAFSVFATGNVTPFIYSGF
jgi:alginate O-acetyltransferase complex protein AlgI